MEDLRHVPGRLVVAAQERGERSAEAALLAVEGTALGEAEVEGVADLVAGAGCRAAVAGHRHRDAAQDQGLGERRQEGVVADTSRVAQHRFRGLTGHGGGQAVDLLAVLPVRQLPVGHGGDLADHIADTGPYESHRSLADDIEVDDDGDRVGHTVRAAARVVVERGDRGAEAVVREVRGHRDERQAHACGGVLRAVDDLAATEADDGVVTAGLLDRVGETDRSVDGAVGVAEPVRLGERRGEPLTQDLAGAAADGEGQSAGGRDALVGQDRRQIVERPRPNVDDDRRGDEPRQYWHAITRPLARSSWLSISTHLTSPMGATSMRKPRFTSSW